MADLKVTITEALKLHGNNQGATHTKTISGINEASRRVVTVIAPGSPYVGTVLCSFGAADGAGTFIAANVKYVRITNLDSADFVTLSLEDTDGTGGEKYAQLKLEAGKSFMLGAAVIDDIDTSSADDFDDVSFENLTNITAYADNTGGGSTTVDLEVFVATS